MDELTISVQEFIQEAYKSGLLDEMLSLSGEISGDDIDLGDALGGLEDVLKDADFTMFEMLSKELVPPLLNALNNEKALEGLRIIVVALKPLLSKYVQNGGDLKDLAEMAGNVGKILLGLKPVLTVLIPALLEKYRPMIEYMITANAGSIVGGAINSGTSAVNRNPNMIVQLISDMFSSVSSTQFREATDTLVAGFLDQKPPLAQWTATTVAKRTKKRILGKRGA